MPQVKDDKKSDAQKTKERLERREKVRHLVIDGGWEIANGEASLTLQNQGDAVALQQEIGSLMGKVPRIVGGNTITLPERHLEAARNTIRSNPRFQG